MSPCHLSSDEAGTEHTVEQERVGAGGPEVPGNLQLQSLRILLTQADEVDIRRNVRKERFPQ